MSIKPEELKPCPFCGKEPDISDGDSLYPTGMGWKDEGEYRSYHKGSEVPKEQWCYAAGCSELSGGCGAEMPGDSRQEAIDKWNARAIPDTHRVVSEELLSRIMELAGVALVYQPFGTKDRQHFDALMAIIKDNRS